MDNTKERILIAPGIKENDLKKSLALRGINTFNLRILSAEELAKRALLLSGIALGAEIMSEQEEAVILSKESPKEPYFSDITYTDVIRIASAIRRARSFITSPDEEAEFERILSKGPFDAKNRALINIYKRLKSIVKESGKPDRIDIIRKAIAEAKPMDGEILTLEEFPLNPLEKSLAEHLNGGAITPVKLHEFFGLPEKEVKVDAYYNCYGASNEVQHILDLIYRERKLDECVVALADVAAYSQLFFDYSLLYDIPITFGAGIPIGNSNPAKLLKLYHHWSGDGLYGRLSIMQMLNSPAFDRKKLKEKFPEDENFRWPKFVDLLGDIRFTENKEENLEIVKKYEEAVRAEEETVNKNRADEWRSYRNKLTCLPALKIMAEELGEPCEVFISRYAYIRSVVDGKTGHLLNILDSAASAAIYDELSIVRNAGIDFSDKDLIKNLLKKSVCAQKSAPGCMHITTIPGAFSSLRKNLFVAGLGASAFPGSPREDYLLLDADLECFDSDVEDYKSDGATRKKIANLRNLLAFAASMDVSVTLSYSGQNLSELKKENASSFIFDTLATQHGSDKKYEELEDYILKVGYFQPAISATRLIGESYNARKKIEAEEVQMSMPVKKEPNEDGEVKTEGAEAAATGAEADGVEAAEAPDEITVGGSIVRRFSPSALESFFSCPKKFFLSYVLGLSEPVEDDLFSVIAANDRGTLAHSLMEYSGEHRDISVEEFLEVCEQTFDRYILENRPLIQENVQNVKEDFLEMMKNAKEMETENEIVLKEEDISAVYGSKLVLHGYPDRVEKLPNGKLLVVDFKTGYNVKHIKEDVDTCLQVMIYAYILHKAGYEVEGGEYRYPRAGETVICHFNDATCKALFKKLDEFYEAIEKEDFPFQDNTELRKESCQYCKFSAVCGLNPDWEGAK